MSTLTYTRAQRSGEPARPVGGACSDRGAGGSIGSGTSRFPADAGRFLPNLVNVALSRTKQLLIIVAHRIISARRIRVVFLIDC